MFEYEDPTRTRQRDGAQLNGQVSRHIVVTNASRDFPHLFLRCVIRVGIQIRLDVAKVARPSTIQYHNDNMVPNNWR
jgi:hypothetical protein